MGYVSKNLMDNEEIVHMAKLNWFIYIPGILMIISSIVILPIVKEINNISVLFDIILFFAGFYSLIKAFILKISTELAVTSKRVVAKTGLIKRETLELNHSKVESFNIEQSIFGRLFNFGTVIVRGTGGGKIPIPNIDDPMLFRKEAMQTIDKVENN